MSGKLKGRRHGLFTDGGSFHPLLTYMGNGDGGLIVVPATEKGVQWVFQSGSLDYAASGRNPFFVGSARSITSVTNAKGRPKLHYHRSGMTSVQLTTGGHRVSVALPSLEEAFDRQIAVVSQRQPLGLPSAEPRPSDTWVHVGDFQPNLAITAFFLVERARLGDLTQRFRNSPRAIIPGRIAYLAVDLQPFGIERVLVIRSAFESGKARVATTSVMGCCALTDKPSDFVAALTADGPLSAVIATTSWLPEFPTDPQERTDDMWLVERGEDGQVLQSRRYADTLPIESEDAQ